MQMQMQRITTKDAPLPGGHYSQAIGTGELLFVAGQLPIDPETGEKELGSIEAQARRCLENLRAILRAGRSDLDRVVKTTVYVADIALWARVNDVYAETFGEHRPARAVVPVPALHHGFLVEIEAIAIRDRPPQELSG